MMHDQYEDRETAAYTHQLPYAETLRVLPDCRLLSIAFSLSLSHPEKLDV